MTTAVSNSNSPGRTPAIKWGGLAAVVAVMVWFFPLVRCVPLDEARQRVEVAAFDAVIFTQAFWTEQLLPATERAVDAGELRAALRADREAAVAQYGHRLGLSGSASFLVQGEGRVVRLTADEVGIALRDSDTEQVRIEIGPVFGNAIRDGSGLLDVSTFSNTRDFNDVSSEINRRVETDVLRSLPAMVTVGTTVRFAGGVELADHAGVAEPLLLVPIVLERR